MSHTSKILVVDDEPKNVKLLDAHLTPRGYDVITASDGEEALERVNGEEPDLVLLDVMMPKMDGFEVTRRLRADEKTRLLPIVLITALKDTEDRVRGIEAGCDDFISKPFDKNEILARVATLIKLSYYRRQLDEKEKFEFVMGAIGEGIVVMDPQWRIARINGAASRFLGISEDVAKDLDVRAGLRERFEDIAELERIVASRSDGEFMLTSHETSQSFSRYLSCLAAVIVDGEGQPTSIVLTVRDVSAEQREELARRDFLSLISHKLRTPLTVSFSSIDFLHSVLSESLPEQQRAYLDRARRGTGELKTIIERLIQFMYLYEPREVKGDESSNLLSVLDAVRESILKRYGGRNIDITVTGCGDAVKIPLTVEEARLVFEHVVSNAIKFNDSDTAAITIGVSRTGGGRIAVAVADNGNGIPSHDHEKIFDKFYQAEKHFTGSVEGLGLGLALVKRIVERAGGSIRVESEVGKGSTFTIVFPSQLST